MRNRRWIEAIVTGAVLLAGTSCHMSRNDPDRPLLARVRANDASAARQLAAGFYQIEDNAWRWTAEVRRHPSGKR